jgi:hypothetical protein
MWSFDPKKHCEQQKNEVTECSLLKKQENPPILWMIYPGESVMELNWNNFQNHGVPLETNNSRFAV